MCLWLLTRRSTLGVCVSDTVITDQWSLTVSEWSSRVSDYSLTRALARDLWTRSGPARLAACVSSYIRTRTCLSLSRVSLCSLARSLSHVSLVCGSLSGGTSLSSRVSWHVFLSLDVPLVSSLASSLSSPLRRGSARLQWRRQQDKPAGYPEWQVIGVITSKSRLAPPAL